MKRLFQLCVITKLVLKPCHLIYKPLVLKEAYGFRMAEFFKNMLWCSSRLFVNEVEQLLQFMKTARVGRFEMVGPFRLSGRTQTSACSERNPL